MSILVEDIKLLVNSFKELEDQKIESIIKEYQTLLEEYCNTKFEPTKDSYKTRLTKDLFTKNKPLLQIIKLNIKDRVLKEDEDYILNKQKNHIEIKSKVFDKLIDNLTSDELEDNIVQIEYLYGYLNMPIRIKQAIKNLIAFDYDKNNSIKSESWDEDRYSYVKENNKKQREDIFLTLSPYVQSQLDDGNVRALYF